MVDSNSDDKLAYFQAITGLEDRELGMQILEAHNWDLDRAVATVTGLDDNSREAEFAANSQHSGFAPQGQSELGHNRSEGQSDMNNINPNSNDGTTYNNENQLVMANPGNPGVVWRIVTLPFSIVRGSFGILSGAIGLGMWVAGGVINHSLSALGWADSRPRNPNSNEEGSRNMPPGTAEALGFINLFEAEYGNVHPEFQRTGFMDALRTSRQEYKFLFVYLHSPEHPNTQGFCQQTLCSEAVVEFLDQNFVSWGGNIRTPEGFRMSNSLKASTFPFCAVVMSANNNRIALLQQVEGPKSPAELLSILQRVIDESGASLVAARAEEEERRHTRRLREEQDAAYQAALEADRAREQQRQVEIERLQREAEEAEQKRKEEEEAMVRAAKEAAEREAALERRRQEKAMSLGAEPEKGPDVTQVLVRFPNGERKERRFHSTACVQSLYDYVDSLNCLSAEKYSLVSNFPRVVYGQDKYALSLREVGLHPQASLFVQMEDA